MDKHILYGDGIHDDWGVLQTWVRGEVDPDTVVWADTGESVGMHIDKKSFFISRHLELYGGNVGRSVTNCYFEGNSDGAKEI